MRMHCIRADPENVFSKNLQGPNPQPEASCALRVGTGGDRQTTNNLTHQDAQLLRVWLGYEGPKLAVGGGSGKLLMRLLRSAAYSTAVALHATHLGDGPRLAMADDQTRRFLPPRAHHAEININNFNITTIHQGLHWRKQP